MTTGRKAIRNLLICAFLLMTVFSSGCGSDPVTPPLRNLEIAAVTVNDGRHYSSSPEIPVEVCLADVDSVLVWNGVPNLPTSGQWFQAIDGCVEIPAWGLGSVEGPIDVCVSAVVDGQETTVVKSTIVLDVSPPVLDGAPLSPLSGAQGVAVATDLAWPAATDAWCPSDSIIYTVLAGISEIPADTVYVGRGHSSLVPNLIAHSSCYWQVSARDLAGNVASGPIWRFDTWSWDLPAFRIVHAGTYVMGSPATEFGHVTYEVQHAVTLTNDYLVASTEIQAKQYLPLLNWALDSGYVEVEEDTVKSTVGSDAYPLLYFNHAGNGIRYDGPGAGFAVDEPEDIVTSITWFGSVSLCAWLSELSGAEVRPVGGGDWDNDNLDPYSLRGFRLPTEAEWEFACRGGATTAFANGDIGDDLWYDPVLEEIGWYYNNFYLFTLEPAMKIPNQYGLYDMHGGTPEWCWDWYGRYPSGAVVNPVNTWEPLVGTIRIARGSSGAMGPKTTDCRSAYRGADWPRNGPYSLDTMRLVWSSGRVAETR